MLRANLETFRSKSGPNGHALSSSILDARALDPKLISNLEVMGGPRLGYIIRAMRENVVLDFFKELKYPYILTEGKGLFRKISSF